MAQITFTINLEPGLIQYLESKYKIVSPYTINANSTIGSYIASILGDNSKPGRGKQIEKLTGELVVMPPTNLEWMIAKRIHTGKMVLINAKLMGDLYLDFDTYMDYAMEFGSEQLDAVHGFLAKYKICSEKLKPDRLLKHYQRRLKKPNI